MATLSKTERRVFLWRIAAKVRPGEAADKGKTSTMEEIVSLLEAAMTAGRARVYLNDVGRILDEVADEEEPDPKNRLYVADISRSGDGKTATLLIIRGDPNIVSPAFVSMKDNTVRVEEPQPQESPATSAHLVVNLAPSGTIYRGCFEQVPGISASLVALALERMLGAAVATNPNYQYDVIKKDSKNKPKVMWRRYQPAIEVQRAESENLAADLERGELEAITLTQATVEYTGAGISKLITRQERKIVLHTAPADKSALVGLIEDVRTFAKEKNFEKITFNLAKLPGGMSNHPTLQVADEQALEHLYVRAQRLTEFTEILQQCYASICLQIEEKMSKLLDMEASW